jgi:murein DD-endopeptidase MepM/ murein hydrolase activator NlpD
MSIRLLLLVILLSPPLTMTPALADTNVPAPYAAAAPTPQGSWPLLPIPEVVHGFAPPEQPWQPGHRGVDLGGYPGQRVMAALPGRVTFAGQLAGRGVIVVNHGATRTTYEPVLAAVSVGTVVRQGDVLGGLDPAGSHCLPRSCLHWGWLRGEEYLNPLTLVGAGAVRLLPLAAPRTVGTGQPASGPRVRLLVSPAQAISGDVGVQLRGRQRGMSEQFLNAAQIGAAFD